MKKTENNMTFEEQITKLEEIAEMLDRGDAPLEELLSKYEEGIALAEKCRTFLDKAEQKVIDISKKTIEQDTSAND